MNEQEKQAAKQLLKRSMPMPRIKGFATVTRAADKKKEAEK